MEDDLPFQLDNFQAKHVNSRVVPQKLNKWFTQK